MARSSIPNPLERRHLVENELDSKSASKIAQAYLAVGRKNEALDFLVKADDQETLSRLVVEAVSDGDPFLLQAIARLTGDEPDRETWNRCAQAAESNGKIRYAATARRNAARSEA